MKIQQVHLICSVNHKHRITIIHKMYSRIAWMLMLSLPLFRCAYCIHQHSMAKCFKYFANNNGAHALKLAVRHSDVDTTMKYMN